MVMRKPVSTDLGFHDIGPSGRTLIWGPGLSLLEWWEERSSASQASPVLPNFLQGLRLGVGTWLLRRTTPPQPKLSCPFFSWVSFPRGALASGLGSPPPRSDGCPGQRGQPSCSAWCIVMTTHSLPAPLQRPL